MENELRPSRIIQGLMRLHDLDTNQLYELIKFDLDHGINFFDLADIYVPLEELPDFLNKIDNDTI